jgi:hypothetical protein
MTENKTITTLYDHYKNTPKKLKIVCDWDEVIQATEPYALLKATDELSPNLLKHVNFSEFFEGFWGGKLENEIVVGYSPYGSQLKIAGDYKELKEKTIEVKNVPDFYQQAPFLTIAEDLLKLIKENKVEELIFLSAYDKRKFPDKWLMDERKIEIYSNTFGELLLSLNVKGSLQLIPFESETQGQSKVDWIKQNASDFDLIIDGNPIICGNIECAGELWKSKKTVIAPYYPAIENQHHKDVLLVKNEVSDLKKEDFVKHE